MTAHVLNNILALSPIGRIKILTYLIWGFLGAAIFDCIIRSCDIFYWFNRTSLGPTVVPAAITSLKLVCVLTMCYFSDNVSSKENVKILLLIFMFYYSDIIAIKNSCWFFSFMYVCMSTASPPLGDYVQVRVCALLVEEIL